MRVPDKIEEISKICKEKKISHIINNAYGLQCSKIAFEINQSMKKGRVDAVIQSTDKNFMVPVGGSIVFCGKNNFVQKLCSIYPGRASGAPIVDLFITLLSLGKNNLEKLLNERKENYKVIISFII